MKTNELRIGNLFSSYNGTVFEWDSSCFELCEKGIEVDEIGLPILLDEYWIIKFKLLKNNGYPYVFLNGFIKLRNGIYFYKYHNLDIELKYVHQIQNLHFALTGKELTIN